MSEHIKDDLLLILEHFEEVNSFFEEIDKPEDFIKTKQGKAYYSAIVMHLQAGSEVLKRNYLVNESVFLKYNEIPWKEIIRLRDLISHHYDKLQYEIVFDICSESVPALLTVMKKILQDIK